MQKTILSVVGARPQFIKHAPIQFLLRKHYNALTLHTGQHYDYKMSEVFFNELNIDKPNFIFELDTVNSQNQGAQTAQIMIFIEKVCLKVIPDALLVYGDTNSTLAGAIVAAKLQIPIIHIEAGLRSFNRSMPEEVNRIIADEFSYLLFCPTSLAISNLQKEGIEHDRIFLCGDVMIDTLRMIKPKIRRLHIDDYYFATIHRPYNTDSETRLIDILNVLNSLDKIVIFPIHPRTKNRLSFFGVKDFSIYKNIVFIDPVSYLESISYQNFSSCVITDSGGVQKEAYALKKKCITIRTETEWSETLKNGWNSLAFDDLSKIKYLIQEKPGQYIENLYGDGNASDSIVNIIKRFI